MEKTETLSIEKWPPVANEPRPYVDPAFERELAKIAGSTLDGKPRLRLVWGQSPEATIFYCGRQRMRYIHHFSEKMVGWEAIWYDKGGKEQHRKRYPLTLEPPKADGARFVRPIIETVDVGIPRWFIEQYMPPEVACAGWHSQRYTTDFEKGEMVDELGPPPTQGMYEEAFHMIADHAKCCPKQKKNGCPGFYRAPDQRDLEFVKYCWYAMNQEPYRYGWEQMPPPEVLKQDNRDRWTDHVYYQAHMEAETEYALRSAITPHRNRIFGSTHGGLDKFTYHDLSPAFSKAKKF